VLFFKGGVRGGEWSDGLAMLEYLARFALGFLTHSGLVFFFEEVLVGQFSLVSLCLFFRSKTLEPTANTNVTHARTDNKGRGSELVVVVKGGVGLSDPTVSRYALESLARSALGQTRSALLILSC
jgi:hypothetical protein